MRKSCLHDLREAPSGRTRDTGQAAATLRLRRPLQAGFYFFGEGIPPKAYTRAMRRLDLVLSPWQ